MNLGLAFSHLSQLFLLKGLSSSPPLILLSSDTISCSSDSNYCCNLWELGYVELLVP